MLGTRSGMATSVPAQPLYTKLLRRYTRPQYQKLFEAARKRELDVVLVWRYDRFARSMRELVNALSEFESLGIDFISYSEGADTTTPQGKLLFGIMASLAEFERSLIAERVKAGMQHAKARGKHTGRPALPPAKRQQIEILLSQKPQPSLRMVARKVGIAPETVRGVQKAMNNSANDEGRRFEL